MLSQDTTDTEAMDMVDTEVMEVMDMEVMVSDMEDTEDTMERDLLMLSQDTTDTEVMDMVEDITDKKLVHINQLKAINHKFYFKTDSFSQLSKLLNKSYQSQVLLQNRFF